MSEPTRQEVVGRWNTLSVMGQLENTLQGRIVDSWLRLDTDNETLRGLLGRCEEWMAEDGCDCGTDEPGSCALCQARAYLGGKQADSHEQPDVTILRHWLDTNRQTTGADAIMDDETWRCLERVVAQMEA
jgi:hypothetical protein